KECREWHEQLVEHLWRLFDRSCEGCLRRIRNGMKELIATNNLNLIASLCSIIKALADDNRGGI
ncbi:MAG: hypothetical protein V2I33_21830, partial [Kangiellaceae bacterium]|nr:hypothetical protein [Kangiellaceae bacterium]